MCCDLLYFQVERGIHQLNLKKLLYIIFGFAYAMQGIGDFHHRMGWRESGLQSIALNKGVCSYVCWALGRACCCFGLWWMAGMYLWNLHNFNFYFVYILNISALGWLCNLIHANSTFLEWIIEHIRILYVHTIYLETKKDSVQMVQGVGFQAALVWEADF